MLEKVRATIIKEKLISSGDIILCAVSGGADSVALLHCLYLLRSEMNFELIAAHFNHQIRGQAADDDQRFVADLCEKLNIKAYFGTANVPEYARENGYTCEQAGRLLRYNFFDKINATAVATAHHMGDQAESVLMHIIRGTGTGGLCGIRYRRNNLIRPLLDIRKSDIEKYIKDNGLTYCTDATNFIEDTTRNKLRLSIIPEISERINPRFTEALSTMAGLVREDEDYLSAIAGERLRECESVGGYLREPLHSLPTPIRRRAIFMAVQRAGAIADIEQKHIELIEGLLTARTGAVLHLPHITAYCSYDKIYFANKRDYAKMINDEDFCQKLNVGCIEIPQGVLVVERVSGCAYRKDRNALFLDYDKLPQDAVLRTRKAGDRIKPIGFGGTKKLKDFFIDKKIPRHERSMPLISSGSDVYCIIGMTVASQVQVTENTTHMLKITFISEGSNE